MAAIKLAKKLNKILIIMRVKIQSYGSLNHALKWLSAFNYLKPHKERDHRRQQSLLIIDFFWHCTISYGLPLCR